jgi:hypothetical protein
MRESFRWRWLPQELLIKPSEYASARVPALCFIAQVRKNPTASRRSESRGIDWNDDLHGRGVFMGAGWFCARYVYTLLWHAKNAGTMPALRETARLRLGRRAVF